MCGIAGIFSYRATTGIDREELRKIRDHMAARGPDGVGEWISDDGRIGLGHRRLSIIDLSSGGAQPMQSHDGSLRITFNGEIYNYGALRTQLEERGYAFRTQSDTEVLLHLYADKGESMVQDLRGMFAFGLWDSVRKVLLLARDPFGVKPLYYADDGARLRFASQVKALVAGEHISHSLDPAAITGFCTFGSVPEPFTIMQEIRALPAGSILRVEQGIRGEPIQYFEIGRVFAEAVGHAVGNADQADEGLVREALCDSVLHHLVADVPVGVFLSAGIDSGAIAGLAAEGLRRRGATLQAVTVAFDEFRGHSDDEAPIAAEVARLFGAHHSVRVIRQAEFESDLPRILAAMDQPTIDGINIWFVSKAAHESGLKVALSGLGGDELFGGYPSFRDLPVWVRASQLPRRIPVLGPVLRRVYDISARVLSHKNPKAAGLAEYGSTYPGAYLLRRGLFMPWELPGLLGKELAQEGFARLEPVAHISQALAPDSGSPFGRVAAMEIALYMRNQLLRDADWASMAHSLEVRVPLIDRKLLETIAPLLVGQNRPPGKRWLACASRPVLPKAVVQRTKTGFTTPISQWMPPSLGLGETSAKRCSVGAHWSRRWALAVLSQYVPDVFDLPAAA